MTSLIILAKNSHTNELMRSEKQVTNNTSVIVLHVRILHNGLSVKDCQDEFNFALGV